MSRRKHHAGAPASSSRTPALLIAFSSLLLSAGLATSLYVLNESLQDQLDGDLDQAGVVAWWTTEAALKWAMISSAGSLCGVTGILLHNPALHRVFAVSTFADLLLTSLLTFTLSLLTLTPSLAPTFGSFLCSSILSSSYDSPTSGPHRILRYERDSTSQFAPAGGIDLEAWGVEACEEEWKSGMVKVILGCAVAVALRVYGVWVSWEMNGELKDGERGGLVRRLEESDWVDADEGGDSTPLKPTRRRESIDKVAIEHQLSNHRRSRSTSSSRGGSSSKRSNTLPATGLPPRYSDPSASRPRSQSSSASSTSSGRPRLVLLPVYVDRQGNPIGSPTSSPRSPPAYRSPITPDRSPQARSSKSPSFSTTTRPSPPPRKRSHSYAHPPSSPSSCSSAKRSLPSPSTSAAPLPPFYTDEPIALALSPTSSGSTTPTCTSNSTETISFSSTSKSVGRSRKGRQHRSETDAVIVPSTLSPSAPLSIMA